MKTVAMDKIERLITFICGDISVTIWIGLAGILSDVTHFGLQVLTTIIIGAAGGFAGMVGKDIYNKVKKRFTK